MTTAKSSDRWWRLICIPRDPSLRPIDIGATLDTLLAGETGMCICLDQEVGEETIAPQFSTGNCCNQFPWGCAVAEPASLYQGEPAAELELEDLISVVALVSAKYTPKPKELN